MTNHEIARRFQQIADTLEIKGENPFKVRAYCRAVEAIEDLAEPLSEIEARGQLAEIAGCFICVARATRCTIRLGGGRRTA